MEFCNKNRYSYSSIWNEINQKGDCNSKAINQLSDREINEVFKYIGSTLETGLIEENIIREKRFNSILLNEFN